MSGETERSDLFVHLSILPICLSAHPPISPFIYPPNPKAIQQDSATYHAGILAGRHAQKLLNREAVDISSFLAHVDAESRSAGHHPIRGVGSRVDS